MYEMHEYIIILYRGVSITNSVLVDRGIHTFLLLGTTRNKSFKRCHCRSEIIAFSIGDFGSRNFASGHQGATLEPDFNYAECDIVSLKVRVV